MSSQAPVADICLLLEGTWPYVRGGVSSWIHQLILGQPEVTFSVVFIGGQREAYGVRQYVAPPNVVHIEEVFLDEAWQTHGARNPPTRDASEAELGALYRFFHHPEQPALPQGEAVLEALTQGRLSLDDVRYSRASWDVLSAGYQQHCSDPSFIDYFWTLRTMQSPLLMLAEVARRVPRARALHAVSTGYAGMLGCLLKRQWDCHFILSEHGIYTKERKIDLAQASWIAENSEESLRGGLDGANGYIRTLWIRFFERIGLLVYNCADPVIALYEGNRQRQIQDGAVEERTQVIPNGIELQQWAPVLAARARTQAELAARALLPEWIGDERVHRPLVVHLDQARGAGVDAEGVEERVNDVDHEQEEGRRRQQRELDAPEPPPYAGAVDGRRFDERLRDRLQAGQEEQEVVGDVLPDRRHDDQRHGVVAVEDVVPLEAQFDEHVADHAVGRGEHHQPQHAGDHRRHRVGPDQQGLVDAGAAHHAVGQHGQQQRDCQAADGDEDGENRSGAEGREVVRVVEQPLEVGHADEFAGRAEGVFQQHALVQSLAGRPEEEDQDDGHLGCDQHPWQPG